MNETKLYPDDPRLTAYALGELEGDERAAVEALLQTDATARAAVDEIRATARQIEAALAAEPETEIISSPRKTRHVERYATVRKLVPFPYWIMGSLAAACFAVVLVLHESQVKRVEQQEKAALVANNEVADQNVRRETEAKKVPESESTSYAEVTFPAPAIPVGRVETQSTPQAAAADKTAVIGTSIAANQPPDVETVKLQASDAAAAPAGGYAASETTGGSRETTDIAGVNNSVAYDFPSRDTAKKINAKFVAGGLASNDPMRGFLYQDHAFDAPANPGEQPQAQAGLDEPRYFKAEPLVGRDLWSAAQNPPSTFGLNGNARQNFNTEAAADQAGGDFVSVAQNPLSTFALNVGTASYAHVRQFLQAGKRPPADAVQIEELVNYFPYAYAAPRDHVPLAATLEVAAAPWAPALRLVRIGLQAREAAAGGTSETVAKDVKVQVEFNPAKVQSYRLIGYEGRTLKKKAFSKDTITAGDVGAGRTVTALYEIVPAGVEPPPGGNALKDQKTEARSQMADARDQKAGDLKSEILNPEILMVTVRYTPIEGGAGRQLEFPLTDRGATFAEASMDFKFAAAVAGFGLILRDSPLKGDATLAAVEQWAGQGLGPDAGGYRAEFIGLVHQAEKLKE
ncbi:MAG TPA: von Willebrand factor type A domain-containing protein [Opitutaceae bacterium]|nr:von Willebrand factor type A domain-containing protein [Opitutaceae bacterium]